MSDTATTEKYQFSNVPVGTHLKSFSDVIHKLVGSAPWNEGDKVAAQQVLTDEFGHPTPIKEFSVMAATAVQQNEDLKKQIAELEKKAEAREAAFNARIDALIAAFGNAGIKQEGNPSGSGTGAPVVVPETAASTSSSAAEEAQSQFAAWKAKQEAEKESQQ